MIIISISFINIRIKKEKKSFISRSLSSWLWSRSSWLWPGENTNHGGGEDFVQEKRGGPGKSQEAQTGKLYNLFADLPGCMSMFFATWWRQHHHHDQEMWIFWQQLPSLLNPSAITHDDPASLFWLLPLPPSPPLIYALSQCFALFSLFLILDPSHLSYHSNAHHRSFSKARRKALKHTKCILLVFR